MNLNANKNVIRSRSKSLMKSDYCNNIYVENIQKRNKQRSLFHGRQRLQKKLSSEYDYILRNTSSPGSSSINNVALEMRQKYNTFNSSIKESMSSCTLMQINQQRYIDILQEVKKILKNDISGKRKVKYLLKKHLTYNNCISNTILRRTCAKAPCISKNDQDQNVNEDKTCYHNLKYFQSKLTFDDQESVENGLIKNISGRERLADNSLRISSLLLNIDRQSGTCSRTPSPALPLLRDESEKSNQSKIFDNSIVKEPINYVENLYKNFEWSGSRYMLLESTYHQTPKSLSKSAESIKISHFGKFGNSSIKKNDPYDKVGNLSTNLGTKSYSRSLTPERVRFSKRSPPTFLRKSHIADLALLENKQSQKTINLLNSAALSLSPLPALSSYKSPELNSYYKNFSCNVTFESSRTCISKISRSMSSSNSYNSKETQIRSCSKESSHSNRSIIHINRNNNEYLKDTSIKYANIEITAAETDKLK